MTVGLKIEVRVGNAKGESAVQKISLAMERAGDNVKDLGRWVYPRLAGVIEREVAEQFGYEGHGPFAGAWAPLSARYSEWKEKHYPGQPILVLTGALKEALTNEHAVGAYREWTASDFDFGTQGIEYASFHQIGTGQMPARPPFDFTNAFERKMQKEVQLGIVEAVRAADDELKVTE